ncbi:hypothetical protein M514_06778 [Trichuris suis]|uniref:Uncharacterized protein n=1 Tax=Trichuris suis TaxID=68888 RepID=A0A085NKI0_9BILA|nr:hypothetical protein M513_06778 [Trichuris suis]KFD69976.1 hypothetical protein M514_06778 [Trichuris suis]
MLTKPFLYSQAQYTDNYEGKQRAHHMLSAKLSEALNIGTNVEIAAWRYRIPENSVDATAYKASQPVDKSIYD